MGSEFPQLRIEPMSPDMDAWSPNHWTAREIPIFIKSSLFFNMASDISPSLESSFESLYLSRNSFPGGNNNTVVNTALNVRNEQVKVLTWIL